MGIRTDPEMHWYTVNTKPRQEHIAKLNLRRLGVETFCPMVKESKVIRRRRQTVVGPLFPCYLFCRFGYEDLQRAVSYARGVRRIVVFGSTPGVVEQDLIDAMKSRLEDGYVTLNSPKLSPGDLVRIQDGPLSGLEAVFERQMSGHQRGVLLLRTLAYQARVFIPLDQLANV